MSIITTMLFSQITCSQDYQSEFLKYCQTNDTINQIKVLTKWKALSPKDPELITSYFNYHFMRSKQEVLSMTTEAPNGEGFVLKDSLNQTAGFLGGETLFDRKELNKGFIIIDKGIKLYPDRLDMRFGKIHTLGQIKEWDKFTSEIIQAVQYSHKNNNNWTWTNDEKKNDGKKLFLSSIQSYQLQLYNTGNDELLKNMQEIATAILKYYPDNIESLSNLSIIYLFNKKYDKAIEILKKAENINPKDYIVLSNIANGYKLKGNKKKAIEYYEKTFEYGEGRAKEYAKQQIIELKK